MNIKELENWVNGKFSHLTVEGREDKLNEILDNCPTNKKEELKNDLLNIMLTSTIHGNDQMAKKILDQLIKKYFGDEKLL